MGVYDTRGTLLGSLLQGDPTIRGVYEGSLIIVTPHVHSASGSQQTRVTRQGRAYEVVAGRGGFMCMCIVCSLHERNSKKGKRTGGSIWHVYMYIYIH